MYKVDQGNCTGCGVCVRICPAGAIGVSRGVAIIDQDRCTACGACAEACPRAAIYELIEEKETAIAEAPERAIITPPLSSLAVKAGKAMLPVAGAALSFIGKRVISQALRVLAQPREDSGSGGDSPTGGNGGKGQGRQHRRRGRR